MGCRQRRDACVERQPREMENRSFAHSSPYDSHLVDEKHAGDKLGHTLVNVLVDDLVDLTAQLLSDLRLLRFGQRAHHGDNVLAALRARVGHVQVVQRHVLNNLLLLVHVALRKGDVLLGFQIVLKGEAVGATLALDGAAVGLNIDDVANLDLFLLQALVNGGVL